MKPRKILQVKHQAGPHLKESTRYNLQVKYLDHNGYKRSINIDVDGYSDLEVLRDYTGEKEFLYPVINKSFICVQVNEACNVACLNLYQWGLSSASGYFSRTDSWNRSKGGNIPSNRFYRLRNLVHSIANYLRETNHELQLPYLIEQC